MKALIPLSYTCAAVSPEKDTMAVVRLRLSSSFLKMGCGCVWACVWRSK